MKKKNKVYDFVKSVKKILIVILVMSLMLLMVACDIGESEESVFTVEFVTNGGIRTGGGALLQKIPQNSPTPLVLPIVTREGYFFEDWYVDSGFYTPFDTTEEITNDICLYAKWLSNDIGSNVASIDFNRLEFGKSYSLGIEYLPESIQANFEIIVDTSQHLEIVDNRIVVAGIGDGYISISDKAANMVLYDDFYQVKLTPLTIEIREQLVRQGEIKENESNMPKDKIQKITRLEIINKLNEYTADGTADFINGIGGLINLTELILSKNGLTDISFVKDLTKLKTLDVSGNNITNISAVNRLYLQNLNFSDNNVVDISPLNSVPLKTLHTLNFNNNKVETLEDALNGLTSLTELSAGGNKFTTIGAISNLTNIRKLDFSYSNVTADKIIALSYFKQLTKLDMSGLEMDITRLAVDMRNLTELRVADCSSGTTVMSVEYLLNFQKLEYLDVSGNNIDLEAFNALVQGKNGKAALTGLKVLIINKGKFVELPNLNKMAKLELLSINENHNLRSIDALKSLPNSASKLKNLSIDNCSTLENSYVSEGQTVYIKDIIVSLPSLEKLSMIDGFQYVDRATFDILTNRAKTSEKFAIRFFEDEWIEKDKVTNLKTSYYFSLEELMFAPNTIVDEVAKTLTFGYENDNRRIVVNLISDFGTEEKSVSLDITFIIPKEIFEVMFVGYYYKTFENMVIEIADRGKSDVTISFCNFSYAAPINTNAINSKMNNPVIIKAQGLQNSITGGLGDNGTKGTTYIKETQKGANAAGRNGGSGTNGTSGGSGIVAQSCEIYVQYGTMLIVKGGNGGIGGQGGDGEGSDRSGTATAGTGGTGGIGGAGGNGIDVVDFLHLKIEGSLIVSGGVGGVGGIGGDGGYGDYTSGNNHDNGGTGGRGGMGGTGGVGIKITQSASISLDIKNSKINIAGGDGADGGNGGTGGNAFGTTYKGTRGIGGAGGSGGAGGIGTSTNGNANRELFDSISFGGAGGSGGSGGKSGTDTKNSTSVNGSTGAKGQSAVNVD